MKLKRFLYLPDGKVFNVYDEDPVGWTKEDVVEDISNTCRSMNTGKTFSIKVIDGTGGIVTLILGSELLKNSYFSYQEVAGV